MAAYPQINLCLASCHSRIPCPEKRPELNLRDYSLKTGLLSMLSTRQFRYEASIYRKEVVNIKVRVSQGVVDASMTFRPGV